MPFNNTSQQGFGKMVENNFWENIIAKLSESHNLKKGPHHITFCVCACVWVCGVWVL
jgi:hypothetical protein